MTTRSWRVLAVGLGCALALVQITCADHLCRSPVQITWRDLFAAAVRPGQPLAFSRPPGDDDATRETGD